MLLIIGEITKYIRINFEYIYVIMFLLPIEKIILQILQFNRIYVPKIIFCRCSSAFLSLFYFSLPYLMCLINRIKITVSIDYVIIFEIILN